MTQRTRVELEPAYVLHVRPWRETSRIVEVFTHDHGRLGLVARGAQRPRSRLRGLLNPFQALHISWSGRGELGTLRDAELAGRSVSLAGDVVLAGFYVNELLLKLLQRADPHPGLFGIYALLIGELGEAADAGAGARAVEPLLRRFELGLLREIGYAPNFATDGLTNEVLQPTRLYAFRADQGAVPIDRMRDDELCLTGADLLAVGRADFSTPERLGTAKRVLRHLINFHLGDRVLQTRRVAGAMKR